MAKNKSDGTLRFLLVTVEDHRCQQDQAAYDVLRERRNIKQVHGVLHGPQNQDPRHHILDFSDAALEGNAP